MPCAVPLIKDSYEVFPILFACLSLYITDVSGKRRLGFLMLLPHLLDNILQFGTTTCCLILLDGTLDCLFKFICSGSKVFDGLSLIDVGNLLAEVARLKRRGGRAVPAMFPWVFNGFFRVFVPILSPVSVRSRPVISGWYALFLRSVGFSRR